MLVWRGQGFAEDPAQIMYPLSKIANQVFKITGIDRGHIYSYLRFSKGRNARFDYSWLSPKKYEPRPAPLTGDELVSGTFLELHYDWHDQRLFLHDFDTIARLEAFILSQISSPWTDFVLAFIKGLHRPYNVTYTTKANTVRIISSEGHFISSPKRYANGGRWEVDWQDKDGWNPPELAWWRRRGFRP